MRTLLTISEAAEVLRISKSLLYQLVERKQIRHLRIKKRILFDADWLDEYLDSCMVGVGSR